MNNTSKKLDLYSILTLAPNNSLIWTRFLEELTYQMNCDSSMLLVTDLIKRGKTHFLFSSHISQKYQERYVNELNRWDLFNYFICKNPRQVFCNQSLVNVYDKEGEGCFIPPSGQKYRFGVSVPCNHAHFLNLLVNRKRVFDTKERQGITKLLQPIVPIIERNLCLEQRHIINAQLQFSTGNYFNGFIIIDRELNILFYDPLYTAIITQLDCVSVLGGRFDIKIKAVKQRLLSLIDNNEKASIHNQCTSCQIMLIPISTLDMKDLYPWECYSEDFIITFTHSKEKNPVIDRLINFFHLSRSEAICALRFMQTPSVSGIATKTCRSTETIRNHLKHTMQKMNVHNQAELMRRLIAFSAL